MSGHEGQNQFYLLRVHKKKKRKEKEWETIIQEKMAENFTEVKKNMNLQFEKVFQHISRKMSKYKFITRIIVVKQLDRKEMVSMKERERDRDCHLSSHQQKHMAKISRKPLMY